MNDLTRKILAGQPLNDAEKLAVAIALCGVEEIHSLLALLPSAVEA